MHKHNVTISRDPRDEAAAQRAQRTPPVWLALAGLSLSMLLASLGTSIANVALPTLAQAFGVSFQAVQWIVLAYLLATTTLIVGVGRLGDVIGRRRLLLAGLCLYAVASVLCGAAPALWLLIAARAAQGRGCVTASTTARGQGAGTAGGAEAGSGAASRGITSRPSRATSPTRSRV